jgi:hypothetical protein
VGIPARIAARRGNPEHAEIRFFSRAGFRRRHSFLGEKIMDLMFAKKLDEWSPEYMLRTPYGRPSTYCLQRGRVCRARQIAAVNAAWWSKEMDKWNHPNFKNSTMAMSHAKYHFASEQESKWQTVYEQGQLYARDTVKPFNPKYGETD